MAAFLGIDPGASGSLCLLDSDTGDIVFLDTPGHGMTAANLRDNLLTLHKAHSIHMAAIEEVHAIFKVSSGSNFAFGFNVGMLHGILQTLPFGLELIPPKTWQSTIRAGTVKKAGGAAKFKRRIADIAIRLYPKAQLFGLKGGLLDGRADALMIAHHLKLKYGGQIA